MILSLVFAFFPRRIIINCIMVEDILHGLGNKHICVIGDVMLDIFNYGSVTRMSPEAPVPVLDVKQSLEQLGGALNVCNNLRTLGASTEIVGVLGDDYRAFRLEYLCEQAGIKKSGLLRDVNRITTAKIRYFDGQRPLLRSDHEERNPISESTASKLFPEIRRALQISDACIIQDYNKGLLTPDLIREIMDISSEYELPVFVDPKFDNVFSYQGAFVIKPNRREAEAMSGKTIASPADAQRIAPSLREQLQCENLLITLGGDGMLLQTTLQSHYFPGYKLKTVDITGAGDTVIAVLSALYSAGTDLLQAVRYANLAAARACEHPGVIGVNAEMLKAEPAE